jgi:hypothetical protein
MRFPFGFFKTSLAITRFKVRTYIRYSLSLRQGEDLLFDPAPDICRETNWLRAGSEKRL